MLKNIDLQLLIPRWPKHQSGLDMGCTTNARGTHQSDSGTIRIVLRDG